MKVKYETETCGRCLGSGRYSWCARFADTCFGCGGQGRRLSKRGRTARSTLHALKVETYGTTATDLTVGEEALILKRWRRLTDVENHGDGTVTLSWTGCANRCAADETILKRPTAAQWEAVCSAAEGIDGVSVADN